MNTKGYVYILTNKTRSVLYVGVTSSLVRRISEHKQGEGSIFTAKYNCHYLVYYEVFPDIIQAIRREKALKNYKRDWKISLICESNPEWVDLYEGMVFDPQM